MSPGQGLCIYCIMISGLPFYDIVMSILKVKGHHLPVHGLWLAVVLMFSYTGDTIAVTRIWKPKPNRFETASSWQGQRIPCYGDTIQLQENRAFLVSQHHTLSGVSFPSSGELIFNEGAVLEVVDLSQSTYQQTPSCPAKASDEPLVANVDVSSWFDPANWKTNADGLERQQIFLDSERIPCNGDNVHLPPGHTFQIAMPYSLKEPLVLKSFKVGFVFLTDRALAAHFSRPEIPPIFDATILQDSTQANDQSRKKATSGVSFLKIGGTALSQWPCDPKYGCKCGNDRREVMTEVCRFVPASKSIGCEGALQVQGLCQPFCGSLVKIKHNSAATAVDTLGRVYTLLDSIRDMDASPLVDAEVYVSITYDNSVQIIFLSAPPSANGTGMSSSPSLATTTATQPHYLAASSFFTQWEKEEQRPGGGKKEWRSIESSGRLLSADAVHDKLVTDGSSGGTVAGVIGGLSIVVLLLAIGGWMFWRRRRQLPFQFRSFGGSDDDPLEMDAGPNFINPLYPNDSEISNRSLMAGDTDTINRSLMDFEDDDRAGLAENEF